MYNHNSFILKRILPHFALSHFHFTHAHPIEALYPDIITDVYFYTENMNYIGFDYSLQKEQLQDVAYISVTCNTSNNKGYAWPYKTLVENKNPNGKRVFNYIMKHMRRYYETK